MLEWSSKFPQSFFANSKLALVFETMTCLIELGIKNQCGKAVGFYLEPICSFCSDSEETVINFL